MFTSEEIKKYLSMLLPAVINGGSTAVREIINLRICLQNSEKALEYWTATPPEQVAPQLDAWQCGTQSCFGGHLAHWPYFQSLGISVGVLNDPEFTDFVRVTSFGVGACLFGPVYHEGTIYPAGPGIAKSTVDATNVYNWYANRNGLIKNIFAKRNEQEDGINPKLSDHQIVVNRLTNQIEGLKKVIAERNL